MQQACGVAAVAARAIGRKLPTSPNSNKNLAVRRCMLFLSGTPDAARIEQKIGVVQTVAGEAPAHTLRFAVDLGPPPADADEEESPVAQEFWRLALESVADELEDPSDHE